MSKNQLSILLLALGVSVLLSNWGGVSDQTAAMLRNEPVRPEKVVFWSSSGSPEMELKIAAQFMAHPDHQHVRVEPNFRETGGLHDMLYVSFLSGNPPDFMGAPVSDLRKYVLFGGLRPYDDLLRAAGEDYFDEYLEGSSRVHRFHVNPKDRFLSRNPDGSFQYPLEAARLLNMAGRAVGLRETSMPDTLTYNKRLFREAARMFPDAGLLGANGEPVPPRTWLEFYQKAKVITDYGRAVAEQRGLSEPVCYGVVLQGQRQHDLMRGIRPLARRAGSMAFDFSGDTHSVHQYFDLESEAGKLAAETYRDQPIGKFDYSHPTYLASFALLYKMKEDGLVLPGMEARHYEDVRTALGNGNAAMVLDGWHAAMIASERVPWASADIGSAPIPLPRLSREMDPTVSPEMEAAEKQAIHALLGLDALGIELGTGNKSPRVGNNEITFFTSACRSPQAAWDWLHFGSKNDEVLKTNCRRGGVTTLRRAIPHLDDPEWFPYPYQKQVFRIMERDCAMWPEAPSHGPVAATSNEAVFYKYFYQQNPGSLPEILQAARQELSTYEQAANRDLALRIAEGILRPEEWTFPDFDARDSETFFARQQEQDGDPAAAAHLQELRKALAASLESPTLRRKILTPQGTIREDVWRFIPDESPWQVLWIPGLMLGTLALWFVIMALRNRRRAWWQQTGQQARQGWPAYLFVLPGLLLIFTFAIYPSLYQFSIALHQGDGLGPMRFVGLKNFTRILDSASPGYDAVFWSTVVPNTLKYMVVVTVGQISIALFLAGLLNMPLRANSLYRVLFFIPLVTSLAIVSVILIGMLKGENSAVNQLLTRLGWEALPYHLGLVDTPGQALDWLGEKAGLGTIMAVGIWHGLPYNIIILLAGLQSISPDLYEAARVDGASATQRFRHITIPELMPILIIIAFQAFIGAARAFSLVFVMTEGGVNHSSELVATYIYKWGFMKPAGRDADLGYASALGIVYSLVLIALTLVNVILIARRWKRRLAAETSAAKGGAQ